MAAINDQQSHQPKPRSLSQRLDRTLAQVRDRQLRTALQGKVAASARYAQFAKRLWKYEEQVQA